MRLSRRDLLIAGLYAPWLAAAASEARATPPAGALGARQPLPSAAASEVVLPVPGTRLVGRSEQRFAARLGPARRTWPSTA